ncbi:MAG: sigma-54 dependent transcriptional regulator [Deltaproteobacteria bacterium]|nr:sigma-54 dependent transcriptional regulator [Deltaproteobacteria bacterium]
MTAVLIVEDDPKIRAQLLLQIREEGFAPTAVESAEAALVQLEGPSAAPPALMLLDVRLPGMSGIDLVRQLAAGNRLPPTIVLSGEASISETVEALHLGVHDFIEKPFSRQRLARSMANTLRSHALSREVAQLRSELTGGEILGQSVAMEGLRRRIAQAAPTDGRVLIRGESGTGKELVADALHRGSPRASGPFVKINCAALPAQLVEDELFGHARGAFTDARSEKAGLFEEADGGTLFLDEIGDMEVALQGRLLRVLEDGLVRRLGETQFRTVDVRILAATHADLEKSIRDGEFREDLYFRLAHLPIDIPPLRQRQGDVQLLFHHFLEQFQRRHRRRAQEVEEKVYPRLEGHPWPGNVRELQSLCERLVVFGGDPIRAAELPFADSVASPAVAATGPLSPFPADLGEGQLPSLKDFKETSERRYLEAVLGRTGWNVSAAARLLGIRRTYLHQRLNALGCHRPTGLGNPEGSSE